VFAAVHNQNYFEIAVVFPILLDIVISIENGAAAHRMGTTNDPHLHRRNRRSRSHHPFHVNHGALVRRPHRSNLTMTNYMTFSLDECPLVINAHGVEAGLINGNAELEYSADGEWSIIDITLDAATRVIVNGKRTWPQVACPPVIAAIIDNRLNKEWYGRVCDAVNEQIASDHEDALEQRAEMRRDARMGL
jgi:hypothetical protein